MSIGAFDATSAYGRVLGATKLPRIAETDDTSAAAGGGFGGMVEKLVSDAATNMRAAETASARQVAGKGDLIDVVTAVGAAETALETVVAVRDRMVNAYSEIMRMQI
jgi:flagellar hook-basal body complex protein FliE